MANLCYNELMLKKLHTYCPNSLFLSLGLLSITAISGTVLSSTVVSANDSSVTTTTINVAVSCSLEATNDTPHTGQVPNGIYSGSNDYYPDGIGQTTLKAFCNDNEGFSIYAVGYSEEVIGNTYLKDSTLDSSTNITTGTATSGNTSNWAMKLGAINGTYKPIIVGTTEDTEKEVSTPDFSNYTNVPSTYTRVAYKNSATDTGPSATGSGITTTYAAYISKTQPAGIYTGKVKYTMVHPSSETPLQPQTTESGYIAYYPNASTAVGSMSNSQGGPVQQLTSSQTTATLLAPNFSRDGYGFAGWSDAYNWATNPSAHFYGPNEDISFTAGQYSGNNDGLSLYAVWVKSAGTFQSNASTVCSNLTAAPATGTPTMASVSALTDERDDQVYAIAKLADGNCWMIENLRLEAGDTRSAEDEALAQDYGKYSGSGTDYGDFIGLADAESSGFDSAYSANSLYSNDGSNNTENIGTSNNPAYRMPRYNHINTDSTSASPTRATSLTKNTAYTTIANANIYGYGNYYTWHAAIANTNYNGTNNQSTTGTSLCPAGWHLPTGGQTTVNTTADFYLAGKAIMNNQEPDQNASNGYGYYGNSLINTNGDTATKAFRKFPNNFVYSGLVTSAAAYTRGTDGYYWSSTANDSYNSYYMYLYSTEVRPGTGGSSKFLGYSIRCLASS